MAIICWMWEENGKATWDGEIHPVRHSGEHVEFYLDARGSRFHIVTGPADGGNYICIPNWKAGGRLASYDNYIGNHEYLCEYIHNEVDAASVASALTHVPEILEALDNQEH